MMFGERDAFAIELEVPRAKEASRYGCARLWIAGEEIGDWSKFCLLSGFEATVRTWIERWEERINDELAKLHGAQLEERIASLPQSSLADARAKDAALRSVSLCANETEAFDGDAVFMVPASDGYATVSVRAFGSDTFTTVRLASKSILGVLVECDAWFRAG